MGVKFTVNEKFFDAWSPAMAYTLGFLCADGSIDRCPKIRASYINFSNTDMDVLYAIKQSLNAEHPVKKRPIKENHKQSYLLRIGSNYMADSLEKLGVYPHKSLTIQLPKIPPTMLSHFVRGNFDGDGCVHIEKQKNRKSHRLRVLFTSGSKIFLIQLEEALRKSLLLKPRKIYNSHKAFLLSYSTSDSLILFDFMYKKPYDDLYLKRKKETFEQYIRASSSSG